MSNNGKLKILQINDVSGVTNNLVKGFRALGDEIEVINPTANIPHRKEFSIGEIILHRMIDSILISRKIRKSQYDIVHVHYAYFAPLVWLSGHEYFLHCHGNDITSNLFDFRFKAITIQSLRKAKKIFFSTPDLGRYVLPIRPDAIFIPNPVDTGFFSPDGRNSDGKNIIFVASRLSNKKGIEIAIEGIRKALTNHKFSVVFMDCGIDREVLKRNIRESIPNAILIPETDCHGFRKLLRDSSIIVGQLKSGAIGMTELEAMSCGKPVISNFQYSNYYSAPPPILNALNSDDVANHIISIFDGTTDAKSLGRKAREWVVRNHDVRIVCNLIRNEYIKMNNNL